MNDDGLIRCTCGDKKCKRTVSVSGNELWTQDHDERESLMYLDPNAKVKLIKALQKSIIDEAHCS
jgi:hypothetical protein